MFSTGGGHSGQPPQSTPAMMLSVCDRAHYQVADIATLAKKMAMIRRRYAQQDPYTDLRVC